MWATRELIIKEDEGKIKTVKDERKHIIFVRLITETAVKIAWDNSVKPRKKINNLQIFSS